MLSQSAQPAGRALRVAALAASLLGCGLYPALQTGMAGSWSGTGTVTLSSGEIERVRCRMTYVVENGDKSLRQDLRCASDSYTLDVESKLFFNADAGRVSGTWSETNYGTGGFFSGSGRGAQIDAKVEGNNFDAIIVVITKGNEQSVTIRPDGTDVTEVAVVFRKSS
jgi:hypothetical protein